MTSLPTPQLSPDRIALGTYGIDTAKIIRERIMVHYKKCYPKKKVFVHFRGRGHRNLYKRIWDKNGITSYKKISTIGGQQDIPLDYATKVAVYLVIK